MRLMLTEQYPADHVPQQVECDGKVQAAGHFQDKERQYAASDDGRG